MLNVLQCVFSHLELPYYGTVGIPPPLFLKIKMSNANIALMDISSHWIIADLVKFFLIYLPISLAFLLLVVAEIWEHFLWVLKCTCSSFFLFLYWYENVLGLPIYNEQYILLNIKLLILIIKLTFVSDNIALWYMYIVYYT